MARFTDSNSGSTMTDEGRFTPPFKVPARNKAVGYMERTRNYYRALGYSADYTWAKNDSVPFTLPSKPLSKSRVALITTTSPAGTTKADTPAVWSGYCSEKPKSMYTDNLAWDKETTHTRDTESYLPLDALHKMIDAGELGSIAPRYHGVPTEYSQRQTLNNDAPEILKRVQEDQADVALLVPL